MTTLYPGFSILPNSNSTSDYGSKLYDYSKYVYNITSDEPVKIVSEIGLLTMSVDMTSVVTVSATRQLEDNYAIYSGDSGDYKLKNISNGEVITAVGYGDSVQLTVNNVVNALLPLDNNSVVYYDTEDTTEFPYKFKTISGDYITTSDDIATFNIPDISSNNSLIHINKYPETQNIDISTSALSQIGSFGGFTGSLLPLENTLAVDYVILGLSGNIYNKTTGMVRKLEVTPSGTIDLDIQDNNIYIKGYTITGSYGVTANLSDNIINVTNPLRTFEFGDITLDTSADVKVGTNVVYCTKSMTGLSGDVDINVTTSGTFVNSNYIDCIMNLTDTININKITLINSEQSLIFPVNSNSIIIKFTLYKKNDTVYIL